MYDNIERVFDVLTSSDERLYFILADFGAVIDEEATLADVGLFCLDSLARSVVDNESELMPVGNHVRHAGSNSKRP